MLPKYYLIYKIINKNTGKSYIGKHITTDPNDAYMGSGKAIRAAISKYGVKSFTKEILHFCSSIEEMNQKEFELVKLGGDSYNVKLGGQGGFDYINTVRPYDESIRRAKISKAHKGLKKNWKLGQIAGSKAVRGKSYFEILGSSDLVVARKAINSNYMKKNNPNKIKITCPYCFLTGSKPPMVRFHFENCKFKTTNLE